MSRPDRYFDWHQVREYASRVQTAADGQLRLRVIFTVFALLVLLIFGRLVQLEWKYGEAYRQVAAQPHERRTVLPAPRGRILSRDGAVLAMDEPCMALAVHYRYLQQPLDARWLRNAARRRLSREERRDSQRVAQAENEVRVEVAELHRRLARMCELSPEQWTARTSRIERRVESIAKSVNERHQRAVAEAAATETPPTDTLNLPSWLAGGHIEQWLAKLTQSVPPVSNANITVAEELDFHIVADEVPLAVVAEIESHPEDFQGVRLVHQRLRTYPSTTLAAHVVGHVATATEEERAEFDLDNDATLEDDPQVGRLGIERQYESLLRGKPGLQTEWTDASGNVLELRSKTEAVPGRDLVLTLDATLQRTCESLLESALRRRRGSNSDDDHPAGGGAIVVIDVRTGEVLALASAPTFDPNAFVTGGSEAARLLSDTNAPLIDRPIQMALPPGSVFKVISSAALLAEGAIDAHRPFFCQGYLDRPDRERCQIYIHRSVGHGETTLSDALVRSCNVYYFHHATEVPPGTFADWAHRFGLGSKTHIDLPYEFAGQVPATRQKDESNDDTQRIAEARALVIGQSTLTATPLQMARAIAAVANDGQLVTPRLVRSFGTSHIEEEDERLSIASAPSPVHVEGLDASILSTLRGAMRLVVADREGTAHATVEFDAVSIAGKTGTAQAGGPQEDHAWFVGYAPHERPRVAFAVVLEHAGSGSLAAGPVARRVVEQLHRLGYVTPRGQRPSVASKPSHSSAATTQE
ncbi:D-transpeptidase MrdA (Penicillin-binding protein 2) (PBP-2) [Durusdinium trenchii]|uniref:D-transpeptidase MrdA (Penicillin-binding protein 2) (PBP-2) n=1 Tax=Durusdinium trenchii TaxID=1381693 RepID=A0ABP0MPU7_9DINO